MLNDNLYARFGRPDYAIALHDDGSLEAGKVGVVSGPTLAAVQLGRCHHARRRARTARIRR